MYYWVCRKCGHEVHTEDWPSPIRWTDGHVCYFIRNEEPTSIWTSGKEGMPLLTKDDPRRKSDG